jgi:phosphoribosylanthranilate isomerase
VVFKVKICGITRPEDLHAVQAAGADAVGINLVSSSKRYVTPQRGAALVREARSLGLTTVIVLMDASADEIAATVQEVDPDAVQLHGHEAPELSTACGNRPIIKALSWSGREAEQQLAAAWRTVHDRGTGTLAGFLVDAYAPGIGGGSGRVADWSLLLPRPTALDGIPLWLAGGLTDRNVAAAILATACAGVDTASGVESAPGIKDAALVGSFTRAALDALARDVAS